MSIRDDLVQAGGAVVWGDLDLVVADVDQSLDGLDLSVAALDCRAWR